MKKLPLSIGILSWKSNQVLIDTLQTYFDRSFLHHVNDVTILFQEFSETDLKIAQHFNIPYLPYNNNIGIGQAFIELTKNAKTDNVLVLEHDWNLIEDLPTTLKRLQSGIDLLDNGTTAVRYRHRKNPGVPHFSFRHRGEELTYYDNEIGATSPHLLDSLHWLEPDIEFADKIQKEGEYFITTSRWGNWTNNPTMYKKQFYLDTVKQFAGDGTALERNIGKWWVNQNFKVAHGNGLFKHNDWKNMENKSKILFIRIPKTGSTSIGTALNTPKGHNTLGYFEERNIYYDYSFAFVRNTYTRLVSWYRHEHNHDIDGFREWVQEGCPVEWDDDWIAHWQDNNPMDQMLYIKNKEGNVDVDFIGFFENIKEDYLEVCNQLNIENPPLLTKIIPKPFHKTKKQTTFSYNAREYYDIETKEKVDELFKEEINYFNFKFFKS